MANATITRLPPDQPPWAWAMRIGKTDKATFTAFIESLKLNIDSDDRRWDADSKQWFFTDDCLGLLQIILRRYRLTFTVDYSADDGHAHRQLMTKQQAAAELYLLPNAPPDVITAVFRTLAKQYHPDHGGSTERMQRLNAAVEVLK